MWGLFRLYYLFIYVCTYCEVPSTCLYQRPFIRSTAESESVHNNINIKGSILCKGIVLYNLDSYYIVMEWSGVERSKVEVTIA